MIGHIRQLDIKYHDTSEMAYRGIIPHYHGVKGFYLLVIKKQNKTILL